MKLASYLVKNRYGVYYLRLQRDGKEWRSSLRTKNPSDAVAIAYRFGAKIHTMKKDHYLIKLPNGAVIKTDGTEQDHARAMEALQEAANLEQQKQSALNALHEMLKQQKSAPLPN